MNTPLFDTLESRTLFSAGAMDTGSDTQTNPPFAGAIEVRKEHSTELDSSGSRAGTRATQLSVSVPRHSTVIA